jgi:23S rRNA pseudouridine1911/1915/1917 synthase
MCLLYGNAPFVFDEADDFAIVYKPPNIHCARQAGDESLALLDWYGEIFPPALNLPGRNKGEGGLMHRLDFLTQGLVLFAKNQNAFEHFLALQNNGQIIKEYSAVCNKTNVTLPGFPPSPGISSFPAAIESYFRPFGPGRKAVRPVLEEKTLKEIAKDKGAFYRTEITSMEEKKTYNGCEETYYHFLLKIIRGFRHQIRCHLAWIGCPIVNDNLYSNAQLPQEASENEKPFHGILALCSCGLSFVDLCGRQRDYKI